MPLIKTRTKKIGTILVIEDNIFMAELLAEKISNTGYEAISVYDGKEALAKLKEEKPSLVLLDLPLSGDVDGFEVLKNIRASHDKVSLPIMILFTVSDSELINKSLELGANFYLIKASTDTEEIISKMEELLKSKKKELPITKLSEIPKPEIKSEIKIKTPGAKLSVPDPKAPKKIITEDPTKAKAKIEKMMKMQENEIPIIDLFDSLVEYAFLARASDIHIEPIEDKILIRLKIGRASCRERV